MEDTAVTTAATVQEHTEKPKQKAPFKKNNKRKAQFFEGKKQITKNDGEPSQEQIDNEDELNDTIFIRNVSRFETTEETLKEYIEKNFGETVYCLICKDRETGESKGTAFVKFKSPETAEQCLDEFEDRDMQTKFFLDGRNLFVLPALTRERAGEVRRAVAGANDNEDGPKKKKIKTKPRHNRAKPIAQSRDDSDQAQTPSSHQKKSNQFKKTVPFKKNVSNNKTHEKPHKQQQQHQHKHKSPARSRQQPAPGGQKKFKKTPVKKGSKSFVKKANQKQRGRHTR